jgi:hypothetical protein
MRTEFWEIVWLFLSIGVYIAANLFTNTPMLDWTFAHLLIAGIIGFLATAICFVLLESILFIVNLAKTFAARERH